MSMKLRFFLITVMVAGSGLCHGQENGAVALNNAQQPSGSGFSEPLKLDLNTPERNPPECPDWARVETPEWVKPFMGVNGAPEGHHPKRGHFVHDTAGIDRYQVNQFVWYRPETAEYLYSEYTPLAVGYKKGTFPSYEALAAKYTEGCKTDTEKAVALLVKALPASCRHPTMPPLGGGVVPTRNFTDEAILKSGSGWCWEQARVFIRLCQVSGIQARMVHLFGQNHTVAEFYADGKWALGDVSNHFVAKGDDGKLLSAAECHDRGAGQRRYAGAKVVRMRELIALSAEALGFRDEASAAKWREGAAKLDADELASRTVYFGVINYPLPEAVRKGER